MKNLLTKLRSYLRAEYFNNARLLIFGGATLAIAIILFAFPESTSFIVADENAEAEIADVFSGIDLNAKAVYVYDVADKKVLYGMNESVPLPIASITKVMTAIVATESGPQGMEVVIEPESLLEIGDSGLYSHERWSLSKLLSYTLVASSNDGAAAIATALGSYTEGRTTAESRQAFVERMNVKARELGLSKTQYFNESGLDLDEASAGAYSTAKDTARLFEYAIMKYPDVFAPTRYSTITTRSLEDYVHVANNTSIIAAEIPGLIAGKTGYSALAGGNLAVAFDAGLNHPVIVVVLGSTYDGRFEDVDALVASAIKAVGMSAGK